MDCVHVEEGGLNAWYRATEADFGQIRKAARAGVVDIKEVLLAKGDVSSWAIAWGGQSAAVNDDADPDDIEFLETVRSLVRELGPDGALDFILKNY